MLNQRNIGIATVSITATTLYGYLIVYLFEGGDDPLETLSWSFIMLLPYAIGAFGIFLHSKRGKPFRLWEAILWPWVYCLGLFAVVVAMSFGMLLCLIIGVPVLLPAASAGGVTVWMMQNHPKATKYALILILCSPVLASPVEAQWATPESTTNTHTWIDINADTQTVWELIKSVNPITEEEHSANWLHTIGFPRPVAATLSHEGIGGVRDATFENGLRFDETITAWEHHKIISFTIVETSEELLPPPLDLIDGENFDVLQGTYEIEHLDEETIRLHLTSEHYLGTRFNRYGSWWTDQIMRNLQNYILEVIKIRAERPLTASD